MHSQQLAFERFFSGLALSAALALAGYAVLIGAGVVAALSPLTYFADEWAWLSFNVVRGHGSFCRLWGHPIFTSNLLLSANYNLYDGAPIGRAVAASSVHVLGMFLVGTLVTSKCSLPFRTRAAITFVFAAAGLSGSLSSKLFWSLGVSDGFVLVGGCIAVHGIARLKRSSRIAWPLMLSGTLLAVCSFGSGLVLPAAITFALIVLRINYRAIFLYLVSAGVMIWVSMVLLPVCEIRNNATSAEAFMFSPWAILKTASVVLAFLPAHIFGQQAVWTSNAYETYWICFGFILICTLTFHSARLLLRGSSDAFGVGLVCLALSLIGATLLIGLTRTAAHGLEVAFQPRYAPITTAFWVLCIGILLRHALQVGRKFYRNGLLIVFSFVLALTNSSQLGHYVAFHQYLAVSSIAVLIAAKSGQVSENLRRYMGLTEWIMKPLPMLVAARKDIFDEPIGRSFMANEPPSIDALACQGTMFRMPQYDEVGIIGFGGWGASASGQPFERIMIYGRDGVVGAGVPTSLQITHSRSDEVELLRGWRQVVFKTMPPVAAAYGIGAGWVGLAKTDGQDIVAIGWTADGACRLRFESIDTRATP